MPRRVRKGKNPFWVGRGGQVQLEINALLVKRGEVG